MVLQEGHLHGFKEEDELTASRNPRLKNLRDPNRVLMGLVETLK